ncbi:Uncharacterised protein [Chlamydia trachomatis]|nr:Uncharacterised protein [Chlamydia trachomatis]
MPLIFSTALFSPSSSVPCASTICAKCAALAFTAFNRTSSNTVNSFSSNSPNTSRRICKHKSMSCLSDAGSSRSSGPFLPSPDVTIVASAGVTC